MSYPKPQVIDPGEAHSNNSKNGGDDAFALPAGSQDDYDIPGDMEHVGVPVRVTDTSNKFNGSEGTCKTFAPDQVKGSNP